MKSFFPRRIASLLLAFALVASLLVAPAAAEGDATEGGGDTGQDVSVTKITLSPDSLSIEEGKTGKITAVIEPETAADKRIDWESSDETVATVNEDGTVDAKKAGTTVITARSTDGSNIKSNDCKVTVAVPTSPPTVAVTGVNVTPSTLELTMNVQETSVLNAEVLPNNATDKTVTWSSNDERYVKVDRETGEVTAVQPGVATITASVTSGKSGSCFVTVKETPSITIAPQGLTLQVNGTGKLSATLPNGISSADIEWVIPDKGKEYVSFDSRSFGVAEVTLRGLKTGSTTITAWASDKHQIFGSCVVTVSTPNPNQITYVDLAEVSPPYLDPNATLDLTATVSPATAPADLEWRSSNNSIATVVPKADNSKQATVTGVAPGKVTITVRTKDGSLSDSIDLEVSGVTLEKSTLSLFVNKSETLIYHLFGSVKSAVPEWQAVNPSIADAATSGRVTGHYPGTTDITVSVGKYKATCTVNVTEDLAQAIERNLGSKAFLSFADIMTELNQRSQSKTGAALSQVYGLEVSTKNGILYYGYVSPDSPGHGVGGSERYYVNPGQGQMPLRDVTFVPKAGSNGTAVIDYTGVNTEGVPFIGTIRVTSTSTGDVSYSTAADRPVTFSAGDFSAICLAKNGKAVNYITFEQPLSARGTLYYNYSPTGQYNQKVDSATRYYPNSTPSINSVTFVPAENYTGPVNVTYHCTDTSGNSYTGNIAITVYAPSGSGAGNVEYTTSMGTRITLSSTDFQNVCRSLTGNNLDYIRFSSLPNTADGVLYYNYTNSNSTRVATGINYYRNGNSSSRTISNITFVPASNYAGTITVPFTGYTTVSGTFNGNLVIRVGDDAAGTIRYNTPVNQPVTFSASDFNNACQRANNAALNRVSFTLPASASGTLYSNYISSASTGTRVSNAESYYRSGSPALSSVTFVPANNYNGAVSIPFTGYDVNGGRFSGTVRITVGSGQGDRTVTYSTVTGGVVRFDAADFNNACRVITGDTLNYLRFDLPASRYGTLYYQYNASTRTGTAVSNSNSYYRTGSSGTTRLLNDVTFVAGSVTGTTTIRYTGTNSNGDTFTGTIEISVKSPTTNVILYTGSSTPIYFRASDFQTACQSALGNPLSYIQFTTLPSSGLLSSGYVSPSQTGTLVATGTRYYPGSSPDISQIAYRPKAETQGVISIPFTGYDTNGGSFTSSVQITLANSYATTPFTDVATGWDWARPSIEFLRQSGITNGYGNNQYGPGRSISRGEFTLMICRAFQFQTTAGAASFPDVPSSSVYAGAVAAARNLGIVQGDNGLFKPNNPITRQSAMTMICRAIQAAGQNLPVAPTTLLSAYSDGGQVSAFARSSVASLIQLGAVRGTTDMRINPRAAISRAEMAVILHRVLTR